MVVVGSVMTSERDSGKELWSNADGFPHFSCEDLGWSSVNFQVHPMNLMTLAGSYTTAQLASKAADTHFSLSLVTES